MTAQASAGGAASSVEVYGFVGWITSAVAFVIFLVWAFLPEEQLLSLGVSYYPSKHWALALPLWISLILVYIYWVYESFNMMTVPELSSLHTIHDHTSKWSEAVGLQSVMQSTEYSIPPLVHVPAPLASRVLYGGQPVAAAEAIERSWQGQAAQPPVRLRRPPSKLALAAAAAEAAAGHRRWPSTASSGADTGHRRWPSTSSFPDSLLATGDDAMPRSATAAAPMPPRPPPSQAAQAAAQPPRPRPASAGAAAGGAGSSSGGGGSAAEEASSSSAAAAPPAAGATATGLARRYLLARRAKPPAAAGVPPQPAPPPALAASQQTAGGSGEEGAPAADRPWRYSLLRRFSEAGSSSTGASSSAGAGAGLAAPPQPPALGTPLPQLPAAAAPAGQAPSEGVGPAADAGQAQLSPAKPGPLRSLSLRLRLSGRRPGGDPKPAESEA